MTSGIKNDNDLWVPNTCNHSDEQRPTASDVPIYQRQLTRMTDLASTKLRVRRNQEPQSLTRKNMPA